MVKENPQILSSAKLNQVTSFFKEHNYHVIDPGAFIRRIFPHTKETAVPDYVEGLLTTICKHCKRNSQGDYGYIRGGTVRQYIRDANGFDHFEPESINSSPIHPALPSIERYLTSPVSAKETALTQRVLEKISGRVTDFDFSINRKHGVTDKQLIREILGYLKSAGFSENNDHIDTTHYLTSPSFGVSIRMDNVTGYGYFPLTVFRVDFFSVDQKSFVFGFHFCDTPEPSHQPQQQLNIRGTADVDRMNKIGITSVLGHVMLNFDPLHDHDSFLNKIGLEYYFLHPTHLPSSYWSEPADSVYFGYIRDLTAVYRSIGGRCEPIGHFLEKYGRKRLSWFLQNLSLVEALPNTDYIRQHLSMDKTAFETRLVPILGDIIFGLVTNPWVWLLLSYQTKALAALPLGQIINTKERLIQLLQTMYQDHWLPHGYKIIPDDPFAHWIPKGITGSYLCDHNPTEEKILIRELGRFGLLEALIKLGWLDSDTPLQYSTLVDLINPLNLLKKPY